ncbi:MAG: hypothetical protein HKO98_06360 [Gemmatimonadetes bacterium]|nr:hypothetical protein [Gemmatimonadota bacterium]
MKRSLGKPILIAATAVIAVSIVIGIVIIGSPTEGRFRQLDSGRIGDLQGIMRATDLFWSRTDRLPESLEELAADPRASVRIVDPGTGEPYVYRVTSPDTYELCATFDRESRVVPARDAAEFWRHGPGPTCFELEVDKNVR